MKHLFAFLLLASCSLPAYAQDAEPETENCATVEYIVEIMHARGWEHVVLRGEAVHQWVEIAGYVGAHLTYAEPDFVVIAFVPSDGQAIVGFGKGETVCDPMALPLPFVKAMLRSV